MRTLIRPTGFVDSPFGHDGKVARLAGGLNWFAQVELIHDDGKRELVPVEGIEARLDEAMAADWARIISPRPALQLGERTIRLNQPQVMGIVNATPDSFSDGGSYADAGAAAEAGAVKVACDFPAERGRNRAGLLRHDDRDSVGLFRDPDGRAVLHAASRIQVLQLGVDVGGAFRLHPPQVQHRGLAHQFGDVLSDAEPGSFCGFHLSLG